MTTIDPNVPKLWEDNIWKNVSIICQENVNPRPEYIGLFSNPFYIINSTSALCLFQFCLIMLVISAASFLLRPLGLPILAQLAGGVVIMGLLFPNNGPGEYMLLPGPVLYIFRTISYFGFILHSFVLGVEINMNVLRRIGKKSITISFCSFASSLLLSLFTYNFLNRLEPNYFHSGSWRLIILQAQSFFGVTCTNVNNLHISNSELGRLVSAVALIIDILTMISSFVIFNIILALQRGQILEPILVFGVYVFLFFVLRPILLLIISYTPHGNRMSHGHFMCVILVVLLATLAGSLVDQYFSVYFFGLSLPQEPLSSILAEKLDVITSGFYFPLFCAIHGFEANFGSIMDFGSTVAIEIVIMSGHLGKFLGTFFATRMFSIPRHIATALSIIITSKGFFDIMIARQWSENGNTTVQEYTITCLHIFVTTFALLPLVRKLYEPSKHYSTLFRQNVSTSSQSGTLQTLVCLYDEENVPGYVNILEALHPSRSNPVPMVTVQLIQLTGRCSLPIMSPYDQAKSYAALKSHISRCDRVVNAFTNIERKYKGYVRLQHYVSVSSYASMHNDICNLAYEKNVSLLILPFHVHWTIEGGVEYVSPSAREVNKMVLEKAPCSVAILINRGDRDLIQIQFQQLHLTNYNMYRSLTSGIFLISRLTTPWPTLPNMTIYYSNINISIYREYLNNRVTIFFLGGPDDQEALAFCKFFANHPLIRVTLIWLSSGKDSMDCLRLENTLKENEGRVHYKEIVCNDGTETTDVLKMFKNEVDLAVVGKHHNPQCAPLLGLDGDWMEYPELGVLADFLLTSDFNFSILVVQQEHRDLTSEFVLLDH